MEILSYLLYTKSPWKIHWTWVSFGWELLFLDQYGITKVPNEINPQKVIISFIWKLIDKILRYYFMSYSLINGNNLSCCILHLLMASYLVPPLGLHSAHRLDTTACPAHRSSLSLSKGFVPVCSFFYSSHPNLLLLLLLLILLPYYYSSTSITSKALIFSSLDYFKKYWKNSKKNHFIFWYL